MENKMNESLQKRKESPIASGFSNNESIDKENKNSFLKTLLIPVKIPVKIFTGFLKLFTEFGTLGIIAGVAIIVIPIISFYFMLSSFGFSFSKVKAKVGPVRIIKIEKLKKIDLLKVYVGDFIENDFLTKTNGKLFGKNEVKIMRIDMIEGYTKLFIDMEKVEQKIIDKEALKLKIILPVPEVDTDLIKEHDECKVITDPDNTNAHNVLSRNVKSDAKRIIAEKARSKINIDIAKGQAEALLQSMYEPLGWHLEFEWKESEL